ncbi:alpha/beta hydrolase [Bradyrhizobium manausense]
MYIATKSNGVVVNDMHEKIRSMGAEFTPAMVQASVALFAPLLPPYPEAAVIRDIKYGYDERHRLDLFGAQKHVSKRPIVIYIHGGGFVAGDKGNAGQPFYNNIGIWAAAQGCLGITATYRLAPAHKYPSGVDDIGAIVAWVRANAGEYGGDTDRIVLIGQSAGASHVASYLANSKTRASAAQSLAGAVLMSGVFDLTAAEPGHFERAYYGEDASAFAACSSVEGLAKTPVRCLFTIGEIEDPMFQRQTSLAVGRWVEEKSRWPDFHLLEAQNHISPVHQIGGSADEVGPLLAKFVKKVIA